MKRAPTRCVVDTNVGMTANGKNRGTSSACVAASARALLTVMRRGHVFLDDEGRIVAEYRKNLRAQGEPGPGDLFLKWLLTHEYSAEQVSRVALTERDDPEDFAELPRPPKGTRYDRF